MTTFLGLNDTNARSLHRTDAAQSSVYSTLIYTVFQQPHERDGSTGIVVALSSANPGEGVTHVTSALVKELALCDLNSVAGINTRLLRRLHEPTIESIRKSISGLAPRPKENGKDAGIPERSLTVPEGAGPWEASWQYRRDCINLLRSEFDYTLIDCPSLRRSSDLLSVAPFVDGVILVIEANRTRREQLLHAERSIAAAQGKLLGYILNKRTYEVPEWIYRLL
jgi:hypothetical protein